MQNDIKRNVKNTTEKAKKKKFTGKLLQKERNRKKKKKKAKQTETDRNRKKHKQEEKANLLENC